MKISRFIPKISYSTGLALLALLVFVYIFDRKIDINGDNCYYYIFASSLASGNGYTDMLGNATAHFPPGYPLLMALVRLFTGSVVAQKVLNLLFLFGAVLMLFYTLVAEGVKKSLAFIVGAAVLVTPHILEFSRMMMSEPSCIFFIMLSLWAFVHLTTDNKIEWRSPWLYIFLSATVYTFFIRTQAMVFVGAFVMALLLARRFRMALLLSGAFVAGYAPWALRSALLGLEQSRYIHQLDFTKVFATLKMLVVQVMPESVLPLFRVHYGAEPSLLLYFIAFSLLALTFFGFYRLKRLRFVLPLFLVGNIALVSIMDTPSYYRYMIIVLPVVTAGLFAGVWGLCDILCRRILKRAFSPWFLLLLFVPMFFYCKDTSKHTVWGLHREARTGYPITVRAFFAMGAEAATRGDSCIVASRKPELLYVHKGVRGVRLKESYTNVQIVRDLLADNVDFIILENMGFRYTREVLYPCFKEHPAFFEPLTYTSTPVNVLFKFHKERARVWVEGFGDEE